MPSIVLLLFGNINSPARRCLLHENNQPATNSDGDGDGITYLQQALHDALNVSLMGLACLPSLSLACWVGRRSATPPNRSMGKRGVS
jgi:hypothetical protein